LSIGGRAPPPGVFPLRLSASKGAVLIARDGINFFGTGIGTNFNNLTVPEIKKYIESLISCSVKIAAPSSKWRILLLVSSSSSGSTILLNSGMLFSMALLVFISSDVGWPTRIL
jgi:hypothetical protein